MPSFVFDESVAAAGETKSRLKANISTTRENVYKVVKQAIAVANDQDVNSKAQSQSLIKFLGEGYKIPQDVAGIRRPATIALASLLDGFTPSDHPDFSPKLSDLPTPTCHPANRIASDRNIYLSPTTLETLMSLSEAAHKKNPDAITFTPELVSKVVEAIHKRTYPDDDPVETYHKRCALKDGSFQSLFRATRMVLFNADPVKSTYQGFTSEYRPMLFTDINPEHFEPRGPLNRATGTAAVDEKVHRPRKPVQASVAPNPDKKQ